MKQKNIFLHFAQKSAFAGGRVNRNYEIIKKRKDIDTAFKIWHFIKVHIREIFLI